MTVEQPTNHQKSALFVVNEPGEFVELQRVAKAARADGYEVTFLFAQVGYANLRRDRTICRFLGFRDFFPGKKLRFTRREKRNLAKAEKLADGYIPYSLTTARPPTSWRSRLFALLLLPTVNVVVALLSSMSRGLTRIGYSGVGISTLPTARSARYARRLMASLRPQLVVFGQEFPGSVNSLITKICSERGIPTLIVPFAVGTTKEIVESLSDKPEYDAERGVSNRLAATVFPHWVNYYRTKRLLRLPGTHVFILEALGLAPEHPWLPNSSGVTAIAVESRQAEQYYRTLQFPAEQLRVTGSPSDDILMKIRENRVAAKRRLCRRMQLDENKRLLVCAWPTDQFGSRFIPLEFVDYNALCIAWGEALSRVARLTDFTIVIRPHPVTSADLLAKILKPYRLDRRITMIDTVELVPLADLFVACVSSTIRWATASGIPAINYDCYDYGYTDFETGGGVFTMKKYSDFEATLEMLTENPEAFQRAREQQERVAADWGIHDGRSLSRVLQLMRDLTGSEAPAPGRAPLLSSVNESGS